MFDLVESCTSCSSSTDGGVVPDCGSSLLVLLLLSFMLLCASAFPSAFSADGVVGAVDSGVLDPLHVVGPADVVLAPVDGGVVGFPS
eukprot:8265004-Prorocentrum_lima.AAC.1